jgi:hypothetical protein
MRHPSAQWPSRYIACRDGGWEHSRSDYLNVDSAKPDFAMRFFLEAGLECGLLPLSGNSRSTGTVPCLVSRSLCIVRRVARFKFWLKAQTSGPRHRCALSWIKSLPVTPPFGGDDTTVGCGQKCEGPNPRVARPPRLEPTRGHIEPRDDPAHHYNANGAIHKTLVTRMLGRCSPQAAQAGLATQSVSHCGIDGKPSPC